MKVEIAQSNSTKKLLYWQIKKGSGNEWNSICNLNVEPRKVPSYFPRPWAIHEPRRPRNNSTLKF